MDLVSAICIGQMGNMVLPMRMGEVARAYAVSRNGEVDTSGALATVAIDRAFDLISLLGVLAIVLTFARPDAIPPDTLAQMKTWGAAFGAVLLAALAFMYAFINGKITSSRKISSVITRFLPISIQAPIESFVVSFRAGLKVLNSGGHLLAISAYSAIVWLLMVAGLFFQLSMFDFPVSLEMSSLMILLVSIGVSIPSSPGFIGPFHAGIVVALGIYGVDPNKALGVAITLHLLMFASTVLFGLFFLWRERMGMREIQRLSVLKK